MQIIINPDAEKARIATEAVEANGGYCPCALEKTPETMCICKAFLNQDAGECHCGRYVKIEK